MLNTKMLVTVVIYFSSDQDTLHISYGIPDIELFRSFFNIAGCYQFHCARINNKIKNGDSLL